MNLYNLFERTLLKNYLAGTAIAVFGMGSLLIFGTIRLSVSEGYILIGIMVFSAMSMGVSEFLYYLSYSKPVRNVYRNGDPSSAQWQKAFSTLQRMPVLAVKRTMLPHFLGITIPAVSLTFLFIHLEVLSLPHSYLLLAFIGAILMSAMHALMEFFLTMKAIQPLLTDISLQMKKQNLNLSSHEETYFLGIKKKLLASSLFLALFPVMFFSLLTIANMIEGDRSTLFDFSNWPVFFLALLILLAFGGSVLLSDNIQKPIQELKFGMDTVKNGTLSSLENNYSDEFSELVSGFNHMVTAIKERDAQNELLLESIYMLMAGTLDARDSYTAGHSWRVSSYAVQIGSEIGLDSRSLDLLRKSAIVHDIGKIGIRDEVLLKDGRLTDEEFEQIKQHPVIGARIIEQYKMAPELLMLVPGVKYHHERFDGKGYPEGLAGHDIPLFGRIIAVADAFDAMTSDRTYRKGMDVERALQILREGKASQWDPDIAEVFVKIIEKEQVKSNPQHANEKVNQSPLRLSHKGSEPTETSAFRS
ncbi:HD-GYP domain-containing protein [Peribacillus glennii]|uniref:HD-GYP domain-containing protein n=1 Tax=Peribacillus glennii TaxID=2303991 RepID=A0A372LGE1_9BACI|nr:HD-GYP domain-containing protein [Peribacillus glennii]RFU65370.1 HD-GYP domain-containing protein [Peribacillus glennii]